MPIQLTETLSSAFRTHEATIAREVLEIEPTQDALPRTTTKFSAARENLIAEEMQPLPAWPQDVTAGMEPEAEASLEKCSDGAPCTLDRCTIFSKEDEIVAVTQISVHAQRMLHETIKLMQVDIRENLARNVPDRNSFSHARYSLSLSLSQLPPACYCHNSQ